MIVVVILSFVAATIFVGLRADQFESAYLSYTDDVLGSLIQARDVAIDDQTQVHVMIDEDGVEVFRVDPETNSVDFQWGHYVDNVDGGMLMDKACIAGMFAGIKPAIEGVDEDMPTDCLGGTEQLTFEPDGSFTLPNSPFPDAGMTLVVADLESDNYSLIEVWPGGMVRKFDEVTP